MKASEKVITLLFLRVGIAVFALWFTLNNLLWLIFGFVFLYYKVILNEITSFSISPFWFPFLSIPGMFILIWLYPKVNNAYQIEKKKIDEKV